MPIISEAHVVLIKNHKTVDKANAEGEMPTPWESYLEQQQHIRPQRFQVHLVVSGFSEREEARSFAENFMSNGSIFVFGKHKRALYRLGVESENSEGSKA